MKITQNFAVKYRYDIHFTSGLFRKDNMTLAKVLRGHAPKVLVFVDSGVARAHPGLTIKIRRWFKTHASAGRLAAPPLTLEGGEQCKNNRSLYMSIAETMRARGLDRHSYVIIIGGGALLDSAGFIAAVTHRGIRQVRVPTTVLSQSDSGVGVKNGINFFGVKNYFGSFSPPEAVINDLDFLATLDERDWISGMAEAFKVAIIKDRSFLDFLATRAAALKKRNAAAMKTLVLRSAKLHAGHIARGNDPFESGSARPLDFGHWSAHYLETVTGYKLRHGEAVAVGVMLDMTIAKNRGLVKQKDYELVRNGLLECGCLLWHEALKRKDQKGALAVYKGLEEFRLHLGGALAIILPRGLGKRCQVGSLSHNEVARAVEELYRFNENRE